MVRMKKSGPGPKKKMKVSAKKDAGSPKKRGRPAGSGKKAAKKPAKEKEEADEAADDDEEAAEAVAEDEEEEEEEVNLNTGDEENVGAELVEKHVWAWWKLYGWCKATVIMYTEETTREGTERTHLLLFDDGEDEAVTLPDDSVSFVPKKKDDPPPPGAETKKAKGKPDRRSKG